MVVMIKGRRKNFHAWLESHKSSMQQLPLCNMNQVFLEFKELSHSYFCMPEAPFATARMRGYANPTCALAVFSNWYPWQEWQCPALLGQTALAQSQAARAKLCISGYGDSTGFLQPANPLLPRNTCLISHLFLVLLPEKPENVFLLRGPCATGLNFNNNRL